MVTVETLKNSEKKKKIVIISPSRDNHPTFFFIWDTVFFSIKTEHTKWVPACKSCIDNRKQCSYAPHCPLLSSVTATPSSASPPPSSPGKSLTLIREVQSSTEWVKEGTTIPIQRTQPLAMFSWKSNKVKSSLLQGKYKLW